MKFSWIVLLVSFQLHVWPALGQDHPSSEETPEMTDQIKQALERARADIEKFGWHLVMVPGADNKPGFVYTLGLWENYGHPEVIVFGSGPNPKGFAFALKKLAERVVAGESFKDGTISKKAFRDHDGAVKNVLPIYRHSYFGIAGRHYGNFSFPSVQLFWPDAKGLFMWQSGFEASLLPFQRALFQDNLILAGIGWEELALLAESQGQKPIHASLEELWITLPPASPQEDWLETWRWHIGEDAELLKVTVFGDVLLKKPDGMFHWLDSGSGQYQAIAERESDLLPIFAENPGFLFHQTVLLHSRLLDYKLQDGEVYSWINYLATGGLEHIDNVSAVPFKVHLHDSGKVFQQAKAGTMQEYTEQLAQDDGVEYEVVKNSEGQYSIWPAHKTVPSGWVKAGQTGIQRSLCGFYRKGLEKT